MKVRLLQHICEEIIAHNGAWCSFKSIYGNGFMSYDKTFLSDIKVRKSGREGVYHVVNDRGSACVVHEDHILFIEENKFKSEIERILEI